MTTIGHLYHWSPRERLASIKRHGLVSGKRNINGPEYHDPQNPRGGEFLQPAVCASTSPATAWRYSHGLWRTAGTFDLWQFSIDSADNVEVRTLEVDQIVEVRVHNSIRKGRLAWVAERSMA